MSDGCIRSITSSSYISECMEPMIINSHTKYLSHSLLSLSLSLSLENHNTKELLLILTFKLSHEQQENEEFLYKKKQSRVGNNRENYYALAYICSHTYSYRVYTYKIQSMSNVTHTFKENGEILICVGFYVKFIVGEMASQYTIVLYFWYIKKSSYTVLLLSVSLTLSLSLTLLKIKQQLLHIHAMAKCTVVWVLYKIKGEQALIKAYLSSLLHS